MRADRLRLLDALEQVELISRFSQRGREAFLSDVLIQSAVLHRLALLGEAYRGLSPTLREAHPEVPWAQIAAFRNVVIHEYFGLDLELVWMNRHRAHRGFGRATAFNRGFSARLDRRPNADRQRVLEAVDNNRYSATTATLTGLSPTGIIVNSGAGL
jgi:uncharacterized protein with HEPN domain